jgi:hypothetical protein
MDNIKLIQGDVIFRTTVLNGLSKLTIVPDNIVVKGDNHSHVLSNGVLFVDKSNDKKFILSTGNTVISHPTHAPITFPVGFYEVSIVKEYDHFLEESREVKD